jgi:hypothetical protein
LILKRWILVGKLLRCFDLYPFVLVAKAFVPREKEETKTSHHSISIASNDKVRWLRTQKLLAFKKNAFVAFSPTWPIFPGFAQDQQHPCEAFGSSLLSLMGNPVQSTASLPELMGSNYPRTHSFKPARRGQTRHFAPPVFRNY